jgi:hypothetical protein
MTAIVNVLWVDDENRDRKADKERFEKRQKNLKIELIRPEKIAEWLCEKDWDLFLIDYCLNLLSPRENNSSEINDIRYPYKGLTVEGIIREQNPDKPIYCVSSKYEELKSGPEYNFIRKAFDGFLGLKDIQRHGEIILYSDAIDYKSIREARKNDLNTLFSLLQAPDEDWEILQLVLPTSLRNGLETNSEGSSIEFACWIKDILFENPGMLYPELNSATYFGMNVEGFESIKARLNCALYTGIFSQTNEPFWWKSQLTKIVFSNKKITKYPDKSPWIIAPSIFEVPSLQRTRCIKCGNEFPECLGISESDPSDIQPVHIHCSHPYSQKEVKMYFEEYRGFKIEES